MKEKNKEKSQEKLIIVETKKLSSQSGDLFDE